jgi:hypothetical protein
MDTVVMRRLEDFAAWVVSLAEPVLRETPLCRGHTSGEANEFVEGFADERGHRRAVDRYLLEYMLGKGTSRAIEVAEPTSVERGTGDVEVAEPTSMARRAGHSPEIELWASLAQGRTPAWRPAQGGSLIFRHDDPAIEIATEAELCALHAVGHLVRRGDAGWATRERMEEAAAWSMAHLQPDNATNHPWAVGVFAELGVRDPEAALYAETLVSNCLALTGRPDRFSACVLLDAGRALSRRCNG